MGLRGWGGGRLGVGGGGVGVGVGGGGALLVYLIIFESKVSLSFVAALPPSMQIELAFARLPTTPARGCSWAGVP